MKNKCSKCGTEISEQVKFCPECGTAQKTTRKKADKSEKVTKSPDKSTKMEGRNIIYVVALISIIVVGFYGYPYVTAPEQANSQDQNSAQVPAQSQTSFNQEEYNHLKSHVQEDPANFSANVNLANFLFDNQRFNESLIYYNAAIQINPAVPDVLVDAGVSHFNLEQFEQSREFFEKALAIDDKHINALYNMGVVSARLGSMDEMRTNWERLMKVAPQSQQAQAAQQMINQFSNGRNQ
jgi:cytochrome c-type biogenesis protein CcmH/NrfG